MVVVRIEDPGSAWAACWAAGSRCPAKGRMNTLPVDEPGKTPAAPLQRWVQDVPGLVFGRFLRRPAASCCRTGRGLEPSGAASR